MRFGWLTLAHSGSPETDYAAIHDLVTQACFAETAGFDGIWLTEHNFTGESVYCDPIPFASVVAARTSRIRIGFAVLQLCASPSDPAGDRAGAPRQSLRRSSR